MRLGVSSVLAFESLFLGFKKWTKASDQVIGGSTTVPECFSKLKSDWLG